MILNKSSPKQTKGYVDVSTFDVGLSVIIVGINLGNFYGNLREGIAVSFNLMAGNVVLNHYLKNGNELWVCIEMSINMDIHEDSKIIGW